MTTRQEALPETMAAVLLEGHGGPEKLRYATDVPVPRPGRGEVLIEVAAAGINNTDINTRTGWYSKAVKGATGDAATPDAVDASWAGRPLEFPRIQGADLCGRVVDVGDDVDPARVGERVLVSTMQQAAGSSDPFDFITFGSECDGAFAQFATARADQTYAVESGLTDVELASFPCAFSTAENMLQRAGVEAGDTVLVTGASGGVGSAAIQLARRRGAEVIAQCGAAKADAVRDLGAGRVVDRGADLLAELGRETVSVVVDLVAGPAWPALPDILKRGGRYVTSGAIAGPLVEFDVRTLYLKDLTFYGCSGQPAEVFADLVGYIERGEIKPVVAATYPLADIRRAQADFADKGFVGKLVLVVPQE